MKLFFSLFFTCLIFSAFSQANLIKDFYTGQQNGIPEWKESSALLGDMMIFAAASEAYGAELYKTVNGNAFLIKDLVEGTSGSDPSSFVYYNGLVYFSAKDATGKYDIYSTDGTAGNTQKVIDLGANDHVYEFFVAANGKLYFNIGYDLYVSDGTASGTSEIIIPGFVNFDNSWVYASTNIVNYLNGVAFHGYQDKTYYIFYHNGSELDTLHKFTAGTFTNVLGPVAVSNGLVYATQDSFEDEVVGLFNISSISGNVSELKIDSDIVDVTRLYEVNGSYCLFKSYGHGFYTFDGENMIEIVPDGSINLVQGEALPHAIVGDEVFFKGKDGFFGISYYISDGTSTGTSSISTTSYRSIGRNILTSGNYAYIFQGISSGNNATIVKIDFENRSSEILYSHPEESSWDSEFELMNVLGDRVYFAAEVDPEIGRELYVFDPASIPTGVNFPISGSIEIVSCDTTIFDDGGYLSNYSPNIESTITLLPSVPGMYVSIDFESFNLENRWDKLFVNNGNDIFELTGTSLPGIIESEASNGGITLTFDTDGSTQKTGFEIRVGCKVITALDGSGSNKITLGPNPTSRIIHYQWPDQEEQYIKVIDTKGNVVLERFNKGEFNHINLQSLNSGVYEVIISSQKSIIRERILLHKK